MKLFDSNACFGMDMVNHECVNHENFIVMEKVDIAKTAEELVAEMDYIGIDKAVVWHRAQYDQDPTAGNQKLINGIRGYEDRLIPSWVILPDITDTEYAPNVFFDAMKANGVKALRAYPEQNRYILCDVTMGEQLNLLTELKIPLYLSPMFGFEMVYNVMKELLSRDAYDHIVCVGIDSDDLVLEAVRRGKMLGSMSQNPWAQGYLSVYTLKMLTDGWTYKEGQPAIVDTGSFLITRELVNDFENRAIELTMELAATWTDRFNPPADYGEKAGEAS